MNFAVSQFGSVTRVVAQNTGATCVLAEYSAMISRLPYEIGVPMMPRLEEIYKNKVNKALGDKDRWSK